MKKIFLGLAFLMAGVAGLSAQKAPKILTVDMEEVYSKYTKAQEAQEKFATAVQGARDELNKMLQEGVKLGEGLQDLEDKANNPALTDKARQGFIAEAQAKGEAIQKKQMEIQQYQRQTDQTLTERRQSVVNLHMSEIKEALGSLAKKKGVDMVLNTSGVVVMYSAKELDVTDEAIKMLNSEDGK